MYKCDFCKSTIERNIKSSKIVTETRKVAYPYRKNAIKVNNKYIDDVGGFGYETVKEKIACLNCETKYSK
ncbi:MAG: hypothetical protein U0354_13140 [Candidatus Sericytochromatia bacterium]